MAKQLPSPRVFFNASVILSGLRSPKGGSAKLLHWVKTKHIHGLISDLIVDETVRRSYKVGIKPEIVYKRIHSLFTPQPVPPQKLVDKYSPTIADQNDAHVLASTQATRSQFLVSLDKKHILILRSKIKLFRIVSPGELIQILSN